METENTLGTIKKVVMSLFKIMMIIIFIVSNAIWIMKIWEIFLLTPIYFLLVMGNKKTIFDFSHSILRTIQNQVRATVQSCKSMYEETLNILTKYFLLGVMVYLVMTIFIKVTDTDVVISLNNINIITTEDIDYFLRFLLFIAALSEWLHLYFKMLNSKNSKLTLLSIMIFGYLMFLLFKYGLPSTVF